MYFVSKVAYLLESAATSWHRRRSSRAVGAGSLPVDFVVVRGGELQQFWVVDVAAEVAAGARRLGAAGFATEDVAWCATTRCTTEDVADVRPLDVVGRDEAASSISTSVVEVCDRVELGCDGLVTVESSCWRRSRALELLVTVWSSVVTVS
jgi:hypothetical protein